MPYQSPAAILMKAAVWRGKISTPGKATIIQLICRPFLEFLAGELIREKDGK